MKSIIDWLIKKYLPAYELVKKDTKQQIPSGFHLHANPKRKEKK